MGTQKPDYAFKSYVLKEHEDLLKRYLKSNKLMYVLSCYYETGEISPCFDYLKRHDAMTTSQLYDYASSNNLMKELHECMKIDKARNARVYRLRSRVREILNCGSSIFVTLTFTDDVLSSTTEEKRRRYVRECLGSLNCLYVGNIDYGETNHREHYHAIVATDFICHECWRYGAINFKRVRLKDRTDTKISKYIAKLTNHAIKETTKRKSLIYSRDKR